jgi:hypothetical protein
MYSLSTHCLSRRALLGSLHASDVEWLLTYPLQCRGLLHAFGENKPIRHRMHSACDARCQPELLVIKESCCVGTTGNVNGDQSEQVDIGDLTALIDYLFITFTPSAECP